MGGQGASSNAAPGGGAGGGRGGAGGRGAATWNAEQREAYANDLFHMIA
jgi:hypothetical protein